MEALVVERPASAVEQPALDVGGEINKELNLKIGHGLRSEAAGILADTLFSYRDTTRAAEELAEYEAGEPVTLSEIAQQALDTGKSSTDLRRDSSAILQQYEDLKGERDKPLDYEHALSVARVNLADAITSKGRGKEQRVAAAKEALKEAMAGRIEGVMALDPKHGKAPYTVPTMNDMHDIGPGMAVEHLAGNHMHLLIETIAASNRDLAEDIEDRSNLGAKKVMRALKRSRPLRVAIGGALWAGSAISAHKGMLPGNAELVGTTFDYVIPIVTAYFTSREVFQGLDSGVKKFMEARKRKKQIADISSDTLKTELTLRAVYTDIEYEGVDHRQASEDPKVNEQRLARVDTTLRDIKNQEGRIGRIEKLDEVLDIVHRLVSDKPEELQAVVEAKDPKQAFIDLSKAIIDTEVDKAVSEQLQSKAKKILYRALSVTSAVLVNNWMNQVGNMQQLNPTDMTRVEATA